MEGFDLSHETKHVSFYAADINLLISTPIDTSVDNIVYHHLLIIHAWYTRCLIPAQECMNSDIFNSALELPTGIYTIHSHVEQHVEHARKFYSQQFILKKVKRHLIIMSS